MQRLVVVGAGVIGLSCAWRAAASGWTVTVLDPRPARGASWVAGGMLAPVTEAWPGEEELLDLGLDSLRRWPRFAADLAAAAGRDPGLRTEGTVVAATGTGDRAELGSLAGFLAGLGRDVDQLTGRELRRLEPALGPDVRGGLSVPGDLAVDNRALLSALGAACERAGVRIVERTVTGICDDGHGVAGIRSAAPIGAAGPAGSADLLDVAAEAVGTAAGPAGSAEPLDVAADVVLVCAGAHSGLLHPALAGLVRPVKGEIVRLAHREGAFPPPSRTVRALVDGRPVYAVPRDGGGLVIGATQYEAGFDTEVTVGGVRDLLRDAERVLPAVAEYALVETAAGLRPGSPDNRPLIGTLEPGLMVATGHGRNGMLLAPGTADAVVGMLRGLPGPAGADPRRFTRRPEPAVARR